MIKVVINNEVYPNFSSFEVEESLSYPFHIKLALVPTAEKPLQEPLLHAGVEITYSPQEGDVDRFTWMDPLTTYYGYVAHEQREYDLDRHLSVVKLDIYHPLFLLQRSCRFRIFHEQKVGDILTAILDTYKRANWNGYKISSIKIASDLSGDAYVVPHCTQYQETDLHFLLRMCETYGVRLSLIDQVVKLDGIETFENLQAPALIIPPIAKVQITELATSLSRTIKHRNLMATEFADTLVTEAIAVKSTTATMPGEEPFWVDLYEPNPVLAKNKLSIQEIALQCQEAVIEIRNKQMLTSSNEPLAGIRAGHILRLEDEDVDLYVHKVLSRITGGTPGSQGANAQSQGYEIVLWARDKNVPYVMPSRHKKPQVFSFLRAHVIEPDKPSEADDDVLGRIKVKFLWQEEQKSDPFPSCWVSLAMPYAGKTHGMYVMPEVGDEVLVGFEGGDIDRPFCLGSVHNKDCQVLQKLSKAQQMETIQLRTPQNICLKFHEVPGKSQTASLAVKDLVVMSFDNSVSASLTSQGTISITSKKDYTHNTDTKITINCNKGAGELVIDQSGTVALKNTSTTLIQSKGNQTIAATAGDQSITASGKQIVDAGGTQDLIAKGAQKVQSTGGAQTIDASTTQLIHAGSTITIEGSGIEIKGGPSVKINATEIIINGGGSTVHLASGVAKVNAGIIKLNC